MAGVGSVLGLREACQQPQLAGVLLLVEPSVADVSDTRRIAACAQMALLLIPFHTLSVELAVAGVWATWQVTPCMAQCAAFCLGCCVRGWEVLHFDTIGWV